MIEIIDYSASDAYVEWINRRDSMRQNLTYRGQNHASYFYFARTLIADAPKDGKFSDELSTVFCTLEIKNGLLQAIIKSPHLFPELKNNLEHTAFYHLLSLKRATFGINDESKSLRSLRCIQRAYLELEAVGLLDAFKAEHDRQSLALISEESITSKICSQYGQTCASDKYKLYAMSVFHFFLSVQMIYDQDGDDNERLRVLYGNNIFLAESFLALGKGSYAAIYYQAARACHDLYVKKYGFERGRYEYELAGVIKKLNDASIDLKLYFHYYYDQCSKIAHNFQSFKKRVVAFSLIDLDHWLAYLPYEGGDDLHEGISPIKAKREEIKLAYQAAANFTKEESRSRARHDHELKAALFFLLNPVADYLKFDYHVRKRDIDDGFIALNPPPSSLNEAGTEESSSDEPGIIIRRDDLYLTFSHRIEALLRLLAVADRREFIQQALNAASPDVCVDTWREDIKRFLCEDIDKGEGSKKYLSYFSPKCQQTIYKALNRPLPRTFQTSQPHSTYERLFKSNLEPAPSMVGRFFKPLPPSEQGCELKVLNNRLSAE